MDVILLGIAIGAFLTLGTIVVLMFLEEHRAEASVAMPSKIDGLADVLFDDQDRYFRPLDPVEEMELTVFIAQYHPHDPYWIKHEALEEELVCLYKRYLGERRDPKEDIREVLWWA